MNQTATKKQIIEIMAPVGSYETLQAAIKAGADSVYFGVGKLNMRSRSAANFTLDDLKKICAIASEAKVKTYLALNTVMYGEELEYMQEVCRASKEAGISAVIAADFAVIEYARSIGLEVHTSTQANVSNIEAVKFFSKYADVIVLARELKLEQVEEICNQIKEQNIKGPGGKLVEIEVFIHGALCVSISGKCYMSLATYNSSANRGACLQNCRRAYRITDEDTGDELVIENKYVMSPRDLCTIGFLDKLINAGVKVLKIEGRGRKADYVYTVVSTYKEAIKAIDSGDYTDKNIAEWTEKLEKVYNRGFWHGGYYMGKRLGEWAGEYGSQATTEKVYVGKGLNYYQKAGKCGIALFHLETGEINIGDKLLITGPTTGVIEHELVEMQVNESPSNNAVKGDEVTIPISEKVRASDKLFVVREKVK